MLTLLTVNVQAAALPRAQRLLAWLDARPDDVVVLTETSNGAGTAHLLDSCRRAGLQVTHQHTIDRDRGTAIISRIPATPRPDLTDRIEPVGRAVAVTLDTRPAVTVLGLYAPSSDRAPHKVAKKRTFLASVTAALQTQPERDRAGMIVAGDYNVISRDHNPRSPAFLPFEYGFLDALADLGFADAHQHRHPGVQAHSWIGRGGNGYRFDYIHAGAALADRLRECSYLHETRAQGLSDHAAVAATVALDTVGTRRADALVEAAVLF